MQYWAITDAGCVREQNQDTYQIEKLDKNTLLCLVCDGMGGAKAGNVASALAAEVFVDEIRNRIMPVNKAYPTEELLAACRRYYGETSRRISFEYAMIDGVNDSVEHAKELIRRLKGLPAHFNLIPLNHVEESPLKPSSRNAVAKFQKILENSGIPATVRRTLGGDIDASCGQLRRKHMKQGG